MNNLTDSQKAKIIENKVVDLKSRLDTFLRNLSKYKTEVKNEIRKFVNNVCYNNNDILDTAEEDVINKGFPILRKMFRKAFGYDIKLSKYNVRDYINIFFELDTFVEFGSQNKNNKKIISRSLSGGYVNKIDDFFKQHLQEDDLRIFDKLRPTIVNRKWIKDTILGKFDLIEKISEEKKELLSEGINICTNTPFKWSKGNSGVEHIVNLNIKLKKPNVVTITEIDSLISNNKGNNTGSSYPLPDDIKKSIINELSKRGYIVEYRYKGSEIAWDDNNCFICAFLDGCKLKKISRKNRINIFNLKQKEEEQLQKAIEMLKQINKEEQLKQIRLKQWQLMVKNLMNNLMVINTRANAFDLLDNNGRVNNFAFFDKRHNNSLFNVNSNYILNFYNRHKNGNGLINQGDRIKIYSRNPVLYNIRSCINNFYNLCNQTQWGENPETRYSKFVNLFVYAYDLNRKPKVEQRLKNNNIKLLAKVLDVQPMFVQSIFNYFDTTKRICDSYGIDYQYSNVIKELIGVCIDHHNDTVMFSMPNNFAMKPVPMNICNNMPRSGAVNGKIAIQNPVKGRVLINNFIKGQQNIVNGNNQQNNLNKFNNIGQQKQPIPDQEMLQRLVLNNLKMKEQLKKNNNKQQNFGIGGCQF